MEIVLVPEAKHRASGPVISGMDASLRAMARNSAAVMTVSRRCSMQGSLRKVGGNRLAAGLCPSHVGAGWN